MDFSNLKKYEISDKKTEFCFESIEGEPTLLVRPATMSNKKYFNALLESKIGKRASKGKLSIKLLEDNRELLKKLYSKYVVTGWFNVLNAEGKEAPFSENNCLDFNSTTRSFI